MEVQKIKATIDVEIPSTHVLVEVGEYNRLILQDNYGRTGDMSWFTSQVSYSADVCKEKLYLFKNELERYVRYPETKGEKWLFQKTGILNWLENNWERWTKARC